MTNKTGFLILLFMMSLKTLAQESTVSGIIKSHSDSTTLPGATVLLEEISDSGQNIKKGQVTDLKGEFTISDIPYGKYLLEINFIGFSSFVQEINIDQEFIYLPLTYLQEETLMMDGVEIVGKSLFGEQIGDTTQFQASAFKTSRNANAEDLVKKLPGVTVIDGKIQAQGEAVMEILVDGKPFFEGDVASALKNLPAEMIKNVQIFDKKSEEAEFSGFDDGEEVKTINIVTKPDHRKGQFGQLSLGYGNSDRYLTGISLNSFNNRERISVSGLSNNINATRYSLGETPGSGLRDSDDGNKNINKISLNYNGNWGRKVEVSGNYAYDNSQSLTTQLLYRKYLSDSGQVYQEENSSLNHNIRHRMKMRLEYDINKNNELIMKPEFSINKEEGHATLTGSTSNITGLLTNTENQRAANSTGMEWKNEIHYRHRFDKKGRTFSSSIELEYGQHDENSSRHANSVFYDDATTGKVWDQIHKTNESNLTWQAKASFTEPLGEHSRIQLEYEMNNRLEDSDRSTYSNSEQKNDYSHLDTLLSNTFNSDYVTQGIELGYQFNSDRLEIEIESEYEHARLQNTQYFPDSHQIQHVFTGFLPSFDLEYQFDDSKNLNFEYRTRTRAPSLRQLQDIINNTNPLSITMGNPGLKQSFENLFELKYKHFSAETSRVFDLRLEASVIQNTISNSIYVASSPTKLNEEITLPPGAQLSRPVNLRNGNWNVGTNFNYGFPVQFIPSNFNVGGGVSYSKRPAMVNEIISHSHSGNFSLRVSLSSNISEKVDFTFSTRSNYSLVKNSLEPRLNNQYFNQSTRFRGRFIWKKISFRTELQHQLNTGLSADYDRNFLICNLSLSRAVFKNERGELSFTINDLLNQNSSIDRNVSELYIEDRQHNILQRFFMLAFTYSIRHYKDN